MKKLIVIITFLLSTSAVFCQDTIFFNFTHILLNNSRVNIDTTILSVKVREKPRSIQLGTYNEYEISLETYTKQINNVKYLWVDFYASKNKSKERLTSTSFEYSYLVPKGITTANLTGTDTNTGISYDIQMKPVLKGSSVEAIKHQPVYFSPFDLHEDRTPKQKCKGKVVEIEDTKSKAVFRSGFTELMIYVSKNLVVPDAEKDSVYYFAMMVKVDCNGDIKNIEFSFIDKKEIPESIIEKLKLLMKQAGKWVPGELNGVAVTSTRKLLCKLENGHFIIVRAV